MKSQSPSPTSTKSNEGNAIGMEWLDLRQLKSYAPVCERTLRNWIHSPVDPLPAVRVRGKIFVRKSQFDKYLERHSIKPLATVDVDGIVHEVLKGKDDGR